MSKTDASLVAIASGSHTEWLLGFHPHPDERPRLLLIGSEMKAFLMPTLNAEGSREFTEIAFHNWTDAQGLNNALALALRTAPCYRPLPPFGQE